MIYIKHISLNRIRGFRELNIDVFDENNRARMRTLIIGRNGTGKSTLLRCIAIGLCDPEDGNSLIAEPIGQLILEGAKSAEIKIELFTDEEAKKSRTITTTLESKNDKEIITKQEPNLPSQHIFACGYGAGRSIEGQVPLREYRIIDSVYTLFNYEQQMHDTELTLRRLQDYMGTMKYEHAMMSIKKVLGLSPEDQIVLRIGGGVKISGPSIGKDIPLEGWADGYRKTFNWIMDFYAWAMRADNITSSGEIKGILMIDELEQHLHPSMQTYILTQLSNLFPEIQIVATTHSPLVALGVSPEELVVLRREGKYIKSEEFVPDFTGYSAEDILVDTRLFNTDVYSPDINEKLSRYRELTGIPKTRRTGEQIEELRMLAKELRSQQLPEVRESALAEELKKFRKKYDL